MIEMVQSTGVHTFSSCLIKVLLESRPHTQHRVRNYCCSCFV